MKKELTILATLALAASLTSFAQAPSRTPAGSGSTAQQPISDPSMQGQPGATTPGSGSGMSQAQSTSISGKVEKSGKKFVLKASNGTSYQLDDQEKAKNFEGQQVKVSGSLDPTTNTIHVSDIAPSGS
ncbi:MAG TPA: DUF5818 domain-containing protein [Terriglobales bacterium]|nr:DUF5818 domain-containing protein [Terriglobales bacterium]